MRAHFGCVTCKETTKQKNVVGLEPYFFGPCAKETDPPKKVTPRDAADQAEEPFWEVSGQSQAGRTAGLRTSPIFSYYTITC